MPCRLGTWIFDDGVHNSCIQEFVKNLVLMWVPKMGSGIFAGAHFFDDGDPVLNPEDSASLGRLN
jgi:hypothetical protein